MRDDNLKFEFEDKLHNIITKTRETDIDKCSIKIYCSSLSAILLKYLYTFECQDLVDSIRDISDTGNPEKFALLIDMIEDVYCSVYENKQSTSDKENRIYDIIPYLDENEKSQRFEFSDKEYNIIGNLIYKRYISQQEEDCVKMGHQIDDVFGNSIFSNYGTLKYSSYDYPTKTEINRYILSLIYMRDIANTDGQNLSKIVWRDVVKHIQENGIEHQIDLTSLNQVNFNVILLANLRVVSVPEGASIWVNERVTWLNERDTRYKTNVELDLKPGEYIIDLKMDGYRDARKEVNLTLDKLLEVVFRLERDEQALISTHNTTHSDTRYLIASNKIMKDTETGLEWVVGPDEDTNWNDARSWVQNLNLDGGGWRLPTLDELESLYEEGVGDNNITPVLKTTARCVWSGETRRSRAWAFIFHQNRRNHSNRSTYRRWRAFAVR